MIRRWVWHLRAVYLLLAALGLGGCAAGPVQLDSHAPKPVPQAKRKLTADQVIARHDAAVAGLDKLWSRAHYRLRWREVEQGEPVGSIKRASAEGKIIVARDATGPGLHGVAVTAGKLGVVGYWSGTDGRRAWLFDLRERGVAWVADVHGELTGDIEAMPVPPQAGPWLLDMLLLTDATMQSPPAFDSDGYLRVEPAPGVRMLLDPRTGRAARVFIDGTDGQGQPTPLLAVHLKQWRPVAVEGLSGRLRPEAPTRLEVYALDQPAHISIRLSGLTDQRIKPGIFDFNVLAAAHQPGQVIDLAADHR